MSDPMERYCSSYYDKHGLYNDGFPCPADKYCCQTDDGTKMCCAIGEPAAKPSNEHVKEQQQQPPRHNNNHHRHHNKNHNPPASVFKLADDPSSFKSHVLTTIQSNLRQQQQQQQQQMVKLTNYEQDQYQQYGIRPPAQNSLGSIDPASPAVYGATTVPFLLSK